MFLYTPPDHWTEKLLLNLSDEDNRFEFKNGEPWTGNVSELEKKLAKEVCALANSFGGTLFLGIEDETKEIVGVPRQYNNRTTSRAWIESLIPNWLEFRLPNFRVLQVDLSLETQSRINGTNADKTVISIDVYDSDLAPHRSLKDKVYYYRQSSKSDPAPHHYLAYLWGRSSPNMSNVVHTWFKIYLNNLIDLLDNTARNFGANKFNTTFEPIGGIPIYVTDIIFFENEKWIELNSSLTAKQFLRTFPTISLKVNEFDSEVKQFINCQIEFREIIDSSAEFERRIRELYAEAMHREGFRQANQFEKVPFAEILRLYAGQVFERIVPGISAVPDDFKKTLVKMITYNLLNLESTLDPSDSGIFNFCKDQIVDQVREADGDIETLLKRIIKIRKAIAHKAERLSKEIDELRYALALKHNTTYE